MRFCSTVLAVLALAVTSQAQILGLPGITLFPSPTTKAPTTTTAPTGGAKGDPILTGLDGRSFEFFGTAGKIYNVLSEKNHQLSMQLVKGVLWDHEGTYMKTVGFKYGHNFFEITHAEDDLIVSLNGKDLTMLPEQNEQEIILGLAEGELSLLWQLHRSEYGNAVEITTDMMTVLVWLTASGTRDEGNVEQPAYLNFQLTLLATPAHNMMKGIIGETYSLAASGTSKNVEDDFKFHGEPAEYEMSSLHDISHTHSIFGKASGGKARRLAEGLNLGLTFPMRAMSRSFAKVV